MEKSQKTINFGYFLRWRQEEMGLTVGEFAKQAGYTERQMLSIQKTYATASRVQGAKLAMIAKAAGYPGRDELNAAWRATPVARPDFRMSRVDGRVNMKARVSPKTRAEILGLAEKSNRAPEDVAGDMLAVALVSPHPPQTSATNPAAPVSAEEPERVERVPRDPTAPAEAIRREGEEPQRIPRRSTAGKKKGRNSHQKAH